MEFDLESAQTLAQLQRRLLALEADRETVAGILADVAKLTEADAAMAAWLNEGAPFFASWNAGPQIEAYFAKTFAGVDRGGNLRSTDPDLDRVNLTRRQMGDGVYHEGALASRAVIEGAAFHRDAFRPAGMNHVIGMTARLAVGEAVFAMGYAAGDASALVQGRAETVLTLLLPAFACRFDQLDQRARNRERLDRAIRESDMDVRLGDESGRDAFLNLPLPGPERSYLAVSPPDAGMLAARLAEIYDLTHRQQETARCLIDGLSTQDVACTLGISLNTARRHCEAVLHKTGARRRGALNALARTAVRKS